MGKGVLEQISSKTCGCKDCLTDYPAEQYGPRAPRKECLGSWVLQWRDGRKRRSKVFWTRRDAMAFDGQRKPGVVSRGA